VQSGAERTGRPIFKIPLRAQKLVGEVESAESRRINELV
jgi:hypothetical protein